MLTVDWKLVLLEAVLLGSFAAVCPGKTVELKNEHLVASFGAKGLLSIGENGGAPRRVSSDSFAFEVDGQRFESSNLGPGVERAGLNQISYEFKKQGYVIDVLYRIEPSWNFVTKEIRFQSTPRPRFIVQSMAPLDLSFVDPIQSAYIPSTYLPQLGPRQSLVRPPTNQFGAFLRFGNRAGVMALVQNPFLNVRRTDKGVAIEYSPNMEWRSGWGSFSSDKAFIGPYTLTGYRIPRTMPFEWELAPAVIGNDGADRAEIRSFMECVRTNLLNPSPRPISVEVGWTLNDYQIDVATPAGRAEYKRIIDTASKLGIQTLVYSPTNSELAQISQDADAWDWEHILWLGFGQKIRKGEWNPETGQIPKSVTEMLDYAKAKRVGILAYVYPSLPFAQNSRWLVKIPGRAAKNVSATLASRDFQDFLIRELLEFKKRTGVAGYSFDYTFLNLPGSAYAQWWGWCRVLKKLREASPGIVIDGRQTYQKFGPWSWLAGNYPHPTGNDEQPESFTPFPDLHFDRVSADRTRYVNYWYRNYQFAPEKIIPGYMTHQTERAVNVPQHSSTGHAVRAKIVYSRYRPRDWDYLGYKYSVISSIATGGWNNVVDMIPARDVQEFQAFLNSPGEDWMKRWLEWTSQNQEYLLHTQTILGPPAIGRVDGTSAIIDDRGYLFLFNPNYKALRAELRLDNSIGLTRGKHFIIHELYPDEGRRIGKPGVGIWSYNDQVSLLLDGTSATVLKIEPAPESAQEIAIFGSSGRAGRAGITDGILHVDGIAGEPGRVKEIGVLLPQSTSVRQMVINGHPMKFRQNGAYVSASVRFAGIRFSQSQQIRLSSDNNGTFSGTFLVPKRTVESLKRVQKAWPIRWDPEDFETTWLVPGRLLMFVQFVQPDPSIKISMTLDGKPLDLKRAYTSVRAEPRCFVGFYADLSAVRPDVVHTIKLQVAPDASGRLQGIFFDNVEPGTTDRIDTGSQAKWK